MCTLSTNQKKAEFMWERLTKSRSSVTLQTLKPYFYLPWFIWLCLDYHCSQHTSINHDIGCYKYFWSCINIYIWFFKMLLHIPFAQILMHYVYSNCYFYDLKLWYIIKLRWYIYITIKVNLKNKIFCSLRTHTNYPTVNHIIPITSELYVFTIRFEPWFIGPYLVKHIQNLVLIYFSSSKYDIYGTLWQRKKS